MPGTNAFSGTDCAIISELMASYADGDLNEAADRLVREHVDACPACAGQLDDLRRSVAQDQFVRVDSEAEAEPAGTADRGRTRGPWLRFGLPVLVGSGILAAGMTGAWLLADDGRDAVAADAPVQVVARMTQVGDDEIRGAGFTLERPVSLRVHALGEGDSGEMYDYAWIVDADSRRPVWVMEYARTSHGGGAQKNRVSDEVVRLEPGNYVLYYQSDGSHSFNDWNSAPPRDQDHWGVILTTVDRRDGRAIGPYDPRSDASVIAQLVAVGDDEHRRLPFALDRETEFRVYAIGEGLGNTMYDYGWIEDVNAHRMVWQMRYEETVHAGGSDKNRLIDTTVRLPAGQYVLHYQTDGSHSFEDWNSAPPADPVRYGVTLFKTDR